MAIDDRPMDGLLIQTEVYINPDGSVTFADLEEKMLPVVLRLDPENNLVCDVPPQTSDAPPGPDDKR